VSDALRILIVDDDRMMARTLMDILRVKGHQAEVAHSGPEALGKIRQHPFDCVLSDIKMPGISGVELVRAIKAERSDLLIILMTAYSSDSLVEEGLEEGAIAVLAKPLNMGPLLTFLSSMPREHCVAIVDDDPQFCRTLGDVLLAQGFKVVEITDPQSVAERVEEHAEVVILDIRLRGISGLDVLREIRELCPDLPVILVTGDQNDPEITVERVTESGAFAFLFKPLALEELLELLDLACRQQLTRLWQQSVGSRNAIRSP
jgi:two-component system response regulator HydG